MPRQFEFLEGRLKIRKIGENWTLISCVFFYHVVVARYVPKLVLPELLRWENKLRYKTDHGNVVKKSNLVQPISQPNLAQCTLCWQFGDQKEIYLAL